MSDSIWKYPIYNEVTSQTLEKNKNFPNMKKIVFFDVLRTITDRILCIDRYQPFKIQN